MINIKKQTVGNRVAIFLQGSVEERKVWHQFFFNWNMTDSPLRQLGENSFSYFVTTKKKFISGMTSNLFGHLIENGNSKCYKKHPEIFKRRAALGAAAKLNEYPENWLLPEKEISRVSLKYQD